MRLRRKLLLSGGHASHAPWIDVHVPQCVPDSILEWQARLVVHVAITHMQAMLASAAKFATWPSNNIYSYSESLGLYHSA